MQVQKDIIVPKPQTIMCEEKKKKEAKYVAMPYGKDPIFVSQKYLDELKLKNQNIPYFKIEDVFDDWKNAYKYFNNNYSNLYYYCRYISDQHFSIQEKDIDEKVDKLQDQILSTLDQMRKKLKGNLKEFKNYYQDKVEKYSKPFEKIKDDYEKFKKDLSTVRCDDKNSLDSLKQSLKPFVKKLVQTQSIEDFKKDQIVEKVDDLRKNQPYYINSQIWDTYQQMIERSIIELQDSYISKNSFCQTQIPNKGFIFQIFQRIKHDKNFEQEPNQLQHLLTDKLKQLFSCSSQELLKNLYKNKDDLKNNVILALIRTSTDQSIGFYYNAKQKSKSLLFSLTKNIILPVKEGIELKMAEHEQISPTLQFGQDLILTSDFKKCTSILGDAFDLRGVDYRIANKDTYLANGVYFDIEHFELYLIDDKDLQTVDPNKQTIPPPFQPQQGGSTNQMPPGVRTTNFGPPK
ncbi:unnamed protein product [Paramecium primaurelia]|uniref:TLDc domain-containing protein n=1 Tax=Paramecium primaurelia TaxID=5886 RepID=A0A8S1KKS4_PARPR|nr:unnamed protein product [Paramecium primaurelia]